MELSDIAEELVIIPKQVFEILLKQDNPGDLIGLYSFYYYTAKWQKTNQPKCTNTYCMKGLQYGEDRFMRAKKKLMEIGLIESVKIGSGKDAGWYVKILYLSKINQEPGKHGSCVDQEPGKHGSCPTKNPENTVQMLNNSIIIKNNNNTIIKKYKKKSETIKRNKPTTKQLYPDVDFDCEEEWKPILQEWFDYKRAKKQSYTPKGRILFYRKLVELSEDNTVTAQKIIDQSIAAPWTGIYPLITDKKNAPARNNEAGTRNTSNKRIDYSKIKVQKISEL